MFQVITLTVFHNTQRIVNTEGLLGYPGLTTCEGIFRESMEKFIGTFSGFLEVQMTLIAEFYRVIHAMEETQKMRLTNVWLECDFALICVVFTAMPNVP